jgi:hypothetical protein
LEAKNALLRLRCEIIKIARAKRCFVSGYVWHITRPLPQKKFLLKFSNDRKCWTGYIACFKQKKARPSYFKWHGNAKPYSLPCNWTEAALKQNDRQRVGKWTESIGVGSKSFLKR